MTERRITAFFETHEGAARAVSRLEASGIARGDISLVAAKPAPRPEEPEAAAEENEAPTAELAGAGAAAGTIAGGAGGFLAGLGTVAIPGFGPIVAAGWIVSTLVGAGLGAATGGLVGALVGAGFSDDEASGYADSIQRGAVLVTVKADEADRDRIVALLDDEKLPDRPDTGPAPPIGAAASTTTGLTTDLLPNPLDDDGLGVEMQDERLRHITGTDRPSG